MVGPESSGKSTLASALSSYWSAPLVNEYAREYLSEKQKNNPDFQYEQSDLLVIAKEQFEAEKKALAKQADPIVVDTDLLVIIIWSEIKFGQCEKWIVDTFEESLALTDRHYILCDWQIPWEPDPLREHPEERQKLYRLYQEKMNQYGILYTAVTGSPLQRFKQVYAATR